MRELFEALPEADQKTVLDLTEFLAARASHSPRAIPEPEYQPRPAEESVVKAIKRLSATYHMLDKSKMLHETSSLMSEHVMQGRPAAEVIDELERIFRRHYEKLRGEWQ